MGNIERTEIRRDWETLAGNIAKHLNENDQISESRKSELRGVLKVCDEYRKADGNVARKERDHLRAARKIAGDHGKPPASSDNKPEPSVDLLEEWFSSHADFFKNQSGEHCYTIRWDNGLEQTFLLEMLEYHIVLVAKRFLGIRIPSEAAIKQIFRTFEAECLLSRKTRDTFLRVGFDKATKTYYLYRGEQGVWEDEVFKPHDWVAVKWNADGWDIVGKDEKLPIRFIEHTRIKPLEFEPKRGGNFRKALRGFGNTDEDVERAIACWGLSALGPEKNKALLYLEGEKGSGKSYLTQYLKRMIDPTDMDAEEGFPVDSPDLYLHAKFNWVLFYGNLDEQTVPPRTLEELCRLATKGGSSPRKHHSQSQVAQMKGCRAAILNGLECVYTKDDQHDRSLVVRVPMIADRANTYKEDWELEEAFAEHGPYVLGSLLDAFVEYLRNRRKSRSEFRMREAAARLECGEEVLGFEKGSSVEWLNRKVAQDSAREIVGKPTAKAIQAFVRSTPRENLPVVITAGELLEQLEALANAPKHDFGILKKSATSLGIFLRNNPHGMRSGFGVIVEYPNEKNEIPRNHYLLDLDPAFEQEDFSEQSGIHSIRDLDRAVRELANG